MLNIAQFRSLIVQPALRDLLLLSHDAEELMVFTCAVESLGGSFLHQVNGPALGIYQMEPASYTDLWQNYIKNRTGMFMIMLSNFDAHNMPPVERLIYDLRFATAITRLYYARLPQPLPSCKDENAIWEYYKTFYNTVSGAAQKESSLRKYHDFLNS